MATVGSFLNFTTVATEDIFKMMDGYHREHHIKNPVVCEGDIISI